MAKDKAHREKAAALKTQEAALTQREATLAAAETKRAERREVYRQNPLAALEDAEVSYEDLTQFVVNNRNLTAEQKQAALQQQVQRLASETDKKLAAQAADFAAREKAREVAATTAQAEQAEQAKTQFMTDIRDVATAEPEKYEMCALAGAPAIQAAFEKVEKVYAETGKVIPITTALDDIEATLYAEAERAVKASKKLGKLLQPPAPPPPPPPPPPPSVTLTSRMVPSTGARTVHQASAQQAEQERRARVIQQINAARGR